MPNTRRAPMNVDQRPCWQAHVCVNAKDSKNYISCRLLKDGNILETIINIVTFLKKLFNFNVFVLVKVHTQARENIANKGKMMSKTIFFLLKSKSSH